MEHTPLTPFSASRSAVRFYSQTFHFSWEGSATPEWGHNYSAAGSLACAPLPLSPMLSVNPYLVACGSHFLLPQNVLQGLAAWVPPGSIKKWRLWDPTLVLLNQSLHFNTIRVHITIFSALLWILSSLRGQSICFPHSCSSAPSAVLGQSNSPYASFALGNERMNGRTKELMCCI